MLSGYVESLLDYPRWVIERDVDFSACHYQGVYTASAKRCTTCQFGAACQWLNLAQLPKSSEPPLSELMNALVTAADYLQVTYSENHEHGCHCDNPGTPVPALATRLNISRQVWRAVATRVFAFLIFAVLCELVQRKPARFRQNSRDADNAATRQAEQDRNPQPQGWLRQVNAGHQSGGLLCQSRHNSGSHGLRHTRINDGLAGAAL